MCHLIVLLPTRNGLSLVFGTSFFTGTDGRWNQTNVEAFLRFTAGWRSTDGQQAPVYGFELGEEMQPEACVHDPHCALVDGYTRFHTLLREVWPRKTPRVMGPCVGMSVETSSNKFLNAFLNHTISTGVLDIVAVSYTHLTLPTTPYV